MARTLKLRSPVPRNILAAASIVLAAATVVRLSVRDELTLLQVLFYGLPRPLLAAALFIVAVLWLARRRWLVATLFAATAAFFVWQWRAIDFKDVSLRPSISSGETVRLLFWNCARPQSEPAVVELAAEIAAHEPDIVALVETRSEESRFSETWASGLSPRHLTSLPGGLIQASNHPGRLVAWKEIGRKTKLSASQYQSEIGLIRVVTVDIDGNPFISRDAAFETIAQIVIDSREPVLVLGDFNTPRDSVMYERFESLGLTNAFDAAGSGYAPTWPVGAPVMMLDQIWTRGVEVVSFEKIRTGLSDHEIIIAEVRRRRN